MQTERMELVDSLRGFALMGLFLVHMVELFDIYWANPTGGPVVGWVFGLFAGKAYALFALCFGLSFFIIMDRAARRGVDFTARFVWRLTLLGGMGLLHSFYYRGDILVFLSLMGLALLPLNRIRDNRVLLALGAACLVQPYLWIKLLSALSGAGWANAPPSFPRDPSMDAMMYGSLPEALWAQGVHGRAMVWSFMYESGRLAQIMGLFLVGLVLGRIGFFASPSRFLRLRRVALAAGLLAWVALTAGEEALIGAFAHSGQAALKARFILDAWASLALVAVQVTLFVELYESVGRPALRLLAPAGRMTLTLYLGQSLVFVPVFFGWGLGLHDDISSGQALTLGLAAFALQLVFAHLWLRAFQFGPVEWAWRAATYRTWKVPFVRRAAEAPAAA